jgi:hypothetical protein
VRGKPWGRGGGALGIAPTRIARSLRRRGQAAGADAVGALWGSPLQGLGVSFDGAGQAAGARGAVQPEIGGVWARKFVSVKKMY